MNGKRFNHEPPQHEIRSAPAEETSASPYYEPETIQTDHPSLHARGRGEAKPGNLLSIIADLGGTVGEKSCTSATTSQRTSTWRSKRARPFQHGPRIADRTHHLRGGQSLHDDPRAYDRTAIAAPSWLGADYINTFADTMRLAANHFDADVPVAGTYIRKAAVQIESAADALREGNLNDLIPGARGSREGNRPRSSAWRCWLDLALFGY